MPTSPGHLHHGRNMSSISANIDGKMGKVPEMAQQLHCSILAEVWGGQGLRLSDGEKK